MTGFFYDTYGFNQIGPGESRRYSWLYADDRRDIKCAVHRYRKATGKTFVAEQDKDGNVIVTHYDPNAPADVLPCDGLYGFQRLDRVLARVSFYGDGPALYAPREAAKKYAKKNSIKIRVIRIDGGITIERIK